LGEIDAGGDCAEKDDRVGEEIMDAAIVGLGPLALVLAYKITYRKIGKAHAVVAADGFIDVAIAVVGAPDRRGVKHLEVIALAIGIEREFPVGAGGENALFDGLRAIEFELRKDRAEIAQMRLGIDRRSVRAGSHEDEAK